MQIDKKIIESSLRKKGFIEGGGDHKYFYHEFNGKRTGPYTFTSRGSKYKSYGDSLLKVMKKHLRLDTLQQIHGLLTCPMDKEEYITILREKNIF